MDVRTVSIAMKERVAATLVSLSVSPGELVIGAGEVGDRFCIVAGGQLDIDVGGLHAAAKEGDYFGEIALLRDVPRTATGRRQATSEL